MLRWHDTFHIHFARGIVEGVDEDGWRGIVGSLDRWRFHREEWELEVILYQGTRCVYTRTVSRNKMLIRTMYVWDVPRNDHNITTDTLAIFQGSSYYCSPSSSLSRLATRPMGHILSLVSHSRSGHSLFLFPLWFSRFVHNFVCTCYIS